MLMIIHTKNMKNLQNISFYNLIQEVLQYQICEGCHNAKVLQLDH